MSGSPNTSNCFAQYKRRSSSRIVLRSFLPAFLLLHGGLLAWSASSHSPTPSDVKHLVAGVSHWQTGRFDLFIVNPPLVRIVAAVPAILAGAETDRSSLSGGSRSRPELEAGHRFVKENEKECFGYFVLGRWVCIPLSILGGWVCFRWSRDLYGGCAGLLALVLWCFSPGILAHGALISADAGAASLGVVAAYMFWRWLRTPSWHDVLRAGLTLGLAELTKSTWIILFVLWPLLWFAWMWRSTEAEAGEAGTRGRLQVGRRGEACQLAVILGLGLYVLNLGYGFEGSFQRLGDYQFVSGTLGGPKDDERGDPTKGRNRFANTCVAAIPVPLPKNYVMGVDLQKWDFERKVWSYLRGEHRLGGWWYYYLYALAVKAPLGTWILVLLALLAGLFGRRYAASWRDESALLVLVVVILTLVSSQTGFNHHVRYVLPISPFVFIWISKVARAFAFGHRRLAAVVVAATAWSVGSSIWVYPHGLSYFNELAGGPRNGHAHLGGVDADTNIDWGQDLLYLKRWLDRHPEARPLHAVFTRGYGANTAEVDCSLPVMEPQPGWHALSVNKIRARTGEYEYFLGFKPIATAGYSIYIYYITLEDANHVRGKLGLPALPADWNKTNSVKNADDEHDTRGQTPTEILLADGTVTAVHGAEELKSGDQKKGRDERIVGSESVSSAEAVVRRVHYQPGAEP